jgi:hypothetical protein
LNGYLKRLATRSIGESQSAAVLPIVRSRSPIAEEDQRLGMPGFGRPNLEDSAPIHATVQDTGMAAGLPPIQNPSPTFSAGGGFVQRKAAFQVATSEFGLQESADTARPAIVASAADNPAAHIRASDRSPASTFRVDGPANGRNRATGSQGPEQPLGDISEIAPNIRIRPDWSAGERSRPSASYDARGDERGMATERPDEAGPSLLEPSPRAMPSAGLREPRSSEVFEAADRSEREPRVVIGRINVEVVPPAAELKTSTQSRSGPLTAESVSVIGPLTRGVRSGLRLSLRHR